MSVVGSDWEALKRFNLAELYQKEKVPKATTATGSEAKPTSVTKDEADVKPAASTKSEQ